MNTIIKRTCLASALCAVCGALFMAAPTASRAQDTPPPANDTAGKQISLDLESSNLYYGLKLLFSQVKANFTIDESLKSLTVTAHFVNVPFRVALETLLKSTGAPLTYKVENGIYSVVPKAETPAEPAGGQSPVEPGDPASGQDRLGIIHTNNVSALDIVQALGGVIVSVGYNSYGFGRLNGNGGLGQGGLGMGGFGQGGFGNNGNGNTGSGNGVGNGFGNYGTGNPAGFNNGRNQGSGNGLGRGF